MTGSKPSAGAAKRNIRLTLRRVIDAPVEAVYTAWTEPEQLRRWLAPGSAAVVRAVAEVEVGGTFLVEMRGPDGRKYLTRGRYLEVVPLVRLVHTWRWEGSEGRDAAHRRVRAGGERKDARDPDTFPVRGGREPATSMCEAGPGASRSWRRYGAG